MECNFNKLHLDVEILVDIKDKLEEIYFEDKTLSEDDVEKLERIMGIDYDEDYIDYEEVGTFIQGMLRAEELLRKYEV